MAYGPVNDTLAATSRLGLQAGTSRAPTGGREGGTSEPMTEMSEDSYSRPSCRSSAGNLDSNASSRLESLGRHGLLIGWASLPLRSSAIDGDH